MRRRALPALALGMLCAGCAQRAASTAPAASGTPGIDGSTAEAAPIAAGGPAATPARQAPPPMHGAPSAATPGLDLGDVALVPPIAGPPPINRDLSRVPGVAADANPQVASVAEARRTGRHPERLSDLIAPPAFDLAAYRRDPAAYINTVEPGRVHHPAQPGAGVAELQAAGPSAVRVPQGGMVELAVRAPARAPVALLSKDLGTFANGLAATTVQAGDDGIARARWYASGGVINQVDILAAGPLTSGQVRFTVIVTEAP